jgi:hypothetical protein
MPRIPEPEPEIERLKSEVTLSPENVSLAE